MMEIPAAILETTIQRGTILHSTIFPDIDHGKFFVVVGVDTDSVAGFFYVNSGIHPSVMRKPAQLAMQYPMPYADYPFLRYDSFLCATKIQKLSKAKLADSMTQGQTTIVGDMKQQHMDELLDACRASRLFSKAEKEAYF